MYPSSKREIFSWALYDWANSAFATTVIAGFYPVFFNQYWSSGCDTSLTTARLGLSNSIAGLAVALSAPVLGALADRGGARKAFLVSFAYLGAVMTAALYLVPKGSWELASLFYVVASIGFSGGIVFYDALLKDVSAGRDSDIISSLGYSLGYLGGGVLFALNVWMALQPQRFGLEGPEDAVRLSFVTVSAWWAVFTVPLIVWVRESKRAPEARIGGMVGGAMLQLKRTLLEIRRRRPLLLFLAAYWFYIDGVDTIVRMAVDYGLSIGLERDDLILALLITQFVGFPSALAFGLAGRRLGTRKAIFFAIGVYLVAAVWASMMRSREEFFALAVTIGLVQGGIQALSRSYYADMIPAERSAEFFGVYNMLGKFAAVMGPVLVGAVGLTARSVGAGPDAASRVGIVSITLLFLAGLVLLAASGRMERAGLS